MSATRSTPTRNVSPWLLRIERVQPDALLDEDEHQDVAGRKGRRTLGRGIGRTP
ncbi:MAG: hypothetical protein LC792_01510 [Actinobacteria bacterium]|nr:hypothetical protein [Actinomycetota bacterium]